MQQHIHIYRMNALCEALTVSRSGFHADLQAQGFCVSVRTVGRTMQALSLRAKYSRQVVGWQMSNRIDRYLVCDALQAALMTGGIANL